MIINDPRVQLPGCQSELAKNRRTPPDKVIESHGHANGWAGIPIVSTVMVADIVRRVILEQDHPTQTEFPVGLCPVPRAGIGCVLDAYHTGAEDEIAGGGRVLRRIPLEVQSESTVEPDTQTEEERAAAIELVESGIVVVPDFIALSAESGVNLDSPLSEVPVGIDETGLTDARVRCGDHRQADASGYEGQME